MDRALGGGGGSDALVTSLQTQFGIAEQTRSPLVLDLDGLNGVETLGKSTGIYFDHDGNKFAEQSGWVGQNDGMLVWDRNANGQIDNGAELFGNHTVLKNGSKADNGFAALAELDSNNDGKVDANDAAASQLRVFKDANSNGAVDVGELLTLAQAGVKSLNTGYTTQAVTDANGNQHLQAGSFTTTSGQTRAMDDVWFAVDTARSIDNNLVAVNSTIAALPDIEGFGNVHSLHQAMARDASGKLQALVQQYAGATDLAVRASLLNGLIYRWAGVQDIDPASRAATQIYGNVIGDARKLATLETFLGEGYQGTWCWGERDPNPHGQAAPILLSAYGQLAQWVDGQLTAQTVFRPLYESIGLRFTPDNQSLEWDVSALVAALKAQYNANPAQGQGMIASFASSLKTMEEAGEQISVKLQQEGNIKGQGFELYLATMGGNPLLGTAGANTLNAKAGVDNVFSAGKGADILNGGNGTDIYIWSKGDGNDTINEVGGTGFGDTLQLLDVTASEVRLSHRADDLYILVGAEQIRVANHFGSTPAALEQIRFSDGSTWRKSVLDAAPSLYVGTGGKDALWGTSLADIIEGGKGADTLYGGAGGDSYAWAKGDGNDMISDYDSVANKNIDVLKLADVAREDVQLSRDIANLYVTIVSTGEKIQVFDHFGGNGAGLERVEFSSGNPLLLVDLNAAPYRGTTGKDTLLGTAAAETFIGGKGVDAMWGGVGSDSYVWVKGDGNDVISDCDSVGNKNIDVLKLADVTREDVQLSRDTAHLYVTIVSTGEKIQVFDHFTGNGAGVERIEFASGDPLLLADLNAAAYRGTAGKDTLCGTAAAEIFIGGKGVDALWGGAGGDLYAWNKGDGNHLEVSVIGTADKATVQDWYLGNAYHVEQIKSGDGKLLLDTQVDKLVQAMARFTPPAMGQTTLTAAQQATLAPVLAVNWH